jgi:F1F0 ATPase subunit 2
MNEALTLVLSLVTGGVLGAIFYLGLWWTVRKGVLAKQPVLWFLGSLLVRMSILLTGFYFVAGHHWERLLLCLLGYVMASLVVVRLTGSSKEHPSGRAPELSHAP